jgi:hypothetical protein
MSRMRSSAKVLLVTGIVFAVGAVVWRLVAVPALVKFPTDTDATLHYAGAVTLFVDPATAAPLPAPAEEPLTVERHIAADAGQSDSSNVLVDETIVEKAGALIDTTQRNAYVMDRRTMLNVADDRAYDFDPANVADRSGTYRVNLPFDLTTDTTYPIYKNETGVAFDMRSDTTEPTSEEAGLTVNNYLASGSEVPLSDAYLAVLDESVPLPRSLTLDQMKPQLLPYGVDIDALLAALVPVLTPADLAMLSQVAADSIPLRYVVSFEGTAAIEPTTGAQLHVSSSETIGARPDLANLPQLREILGRYPNVPEAVSANEGLGKLVTAPATELIEIRYDQTPASVADTASIIASQRSMVMAVRWYVPGTLLAMGVLALVVGGILARRRRDAGAIDLREAARAPDADEPEASVTTEDPVPTGRRADRAPPARPAGR